MAMPGRSPFNGPSSPQRTYNGYPEAQHQPHMYGPHSRNMLPPSPQHYPAQRFPQPPLPTPSPSIPQNNGPSFHKRPGSSMSISSMLGNAEPEKPAQDQYPSTAPRAPSRQASLSGPPLLLGAGMSPPSYASKPSTSSDYTYKPRSRTPDRINTTSPTGSRPHRSSSGTISQRPAPFYDPPPRSTPNQSAMPGSHGPRYTSPFTSAPAHRDEYEDRARRTSISGLLQRPESQPQPSTGNLGLHSGPSPHIRPESIPPSLHTERQPQSLANATEPPRQNGLSGTYDTRPPTLPTLSRVPVGGPTSQSFTPAYDRPAPQSLSPELRRPYLNGSETRPLGPITNQQNDAHQSYQNMSRQDSMQSQSDRSLMGDRARMPNRPYSPFAGSVASQTNASMGDAVRKGSEELSQHRAILSLANDSKRGRYSPVPQAVQGAQAQTPLPDAGIKTEQGRVFSGLGGGLGTSSRPATATPQPLSASPFKQLDGASKLSEENLMKMSRSGSGGNKRARKVLDEDQRPDGEPSTGKKTGTAKAKRGKYQHSYKLDLEEAASAQKKPATVATAAKSAHRAATPTLNNSQSLLNNQSTRQISVVEPKPIPRKTIRISSVLAQAARNPRRHLGFFKYNPSVTPTTIPRSSVHKFDVSIRPNLLPSFTQPENINCTYTVRVSRTWIKERERRLIGAERYLWGSGIYTDDSDPIAAAMHSGFITSVPPAGIDEALLDQIIQDQNSKIEGSPAPVKPVPVPENQDLHITLLVLPQLERYVESARFAIKSRSWPDDSSFGPGQDSNNNKTPHDGVSFMVLKTEFVDDGLETQKTGRTGKEKRERLRRELMERQRGLDLEKKKLAEALARAKLRKENQRRRLGDKGPKGATSLSTTTSINRFNGIHDEATGDSNVKLDVGQSPGEWIRQLTVAAA